MAARLSGKDHLKKGTVMCRQIVGHHREGADPLCREETLAHPKGAVDQMAAGHNFNHELYRDRDYHHENGWPINLRICHKTIQMVK